MRCFVSSQLVYWSCARSWCSSAPSAKRLRPCWHSHTGPPLGNCWCLFGLLSFLPELGGHVALPTRTRPVRARPAAAAESPARPGRDGVEWSLRVRCPLQEGLECLSTTAAWCLHLTNKTSPPNHDPVVSDLFIRA